MKVCAALAAVGLLSVACQSGAKKATPLNVDEDSGTSDPDSGAGGDDAGSPGNSDAGTVETDGGGVDAGGGGDAGSDATTPLVLTSTLLTTGTTWPVAYACGGAAADVSPPLAWSGGPTAQSYAVVMVDAFFMPPKVHWLIYDMPAATSSLASGIPAGYNVATPTAHQSQGDFAGAQFLSPCPPVGGGAHTYEITVHALDVATLPGLTAASSATDTNAAVAAHTIGSAKMSLTYSR